MKDKVEAWMASLSDWKLQETFAGIIELYGVMFAEMTIPELGADRLFNTINPEQDIYTYNGIEFYKWDDIKVMPEIISKEFNTKQVTSK